MNELNTYDLDYRFKNETISVIYDKWLNRHSLNQLPITIFGSGSEGNSVFLKPQKTLIDLGLPYKKYVEKDANFFLNVDRIILTHHHGDHLNPSALLRIMKENPHIRIVLSEFMYNEIFSDRYKAVYLRELDENGNTQYQCNAQGKPIKNRPIYKKDAQGNPIIDPSKKTWSQKYENFSGRFDIATPRYMQVSGGGTFWFEPHTTKHGDIVNIAIEIDDPRYNLHLLSASDLDTLEGATSFVDAHGTLQHVSGLPQETEFNLLLLEANYNEERLNEWVETETKSIQALSISEREKERAINNVLARAHGNLRHISEEESFQYVQKHLQSYGHFIPLHASKNFGTLLQKAT